MDSQSFVELPETLSTDDASLHRVLIVGGGAAGLELATALGHDLGRRRKASITLLDSARIHVWKPLLHEVASGSLDSETDSLEFIAHARWHHYRYRLGAMVGLDRPKQRIYVRPTVDEDGRQIIPPRALGYDTLVVAVGSVSNHFGIPGAAEYTIALDTPSEAARFNRRMINACLRANAQIEPLRPGQLHCVIVGAGATGVELAAELHKTMRELASFNLDAIDFDRIIRITIIEAGSRVLKALPEHLAIATTRILTDLDVTIRTGTRVTNVTADGVTLASGEFIAAELIVWAAGIKAPDFLAGLDGLEVDRLNRLIVGDTLQTTRDNKIFAIGDCASCTLSGTDKPLPPRAQTAHQQAALMVKSIKARIAGTPVPRFHYRDFGSLVSLSKYRTVGHMAGGLKIEGLIARLMYRSLHKMHQRALHGTAKLALDTLGELIARRTEPRIKLH